PVGWRRAVRAGSMGSRGGQVGRGSVSLRFESARPGHRGVEGSVDRVPPRRRGGGRGETTPTGASGAGPGSGGARAGAGRRREHARIGAKVVGGGGSGAGGGPSCPDARGIRRGPIGIRGGCRGVSPVRGGSPRGTGARTRRGRARSRASDARATAGADSGRSELRARHVGTCGGEKLRSPEGLRREDTGPRHRVVRRGRGRVPARRRGGGRGQATRKRAAGGSAGAGDSGPHTR